MAAVSQVEVSSPTFEHFFAAARSRVYEALALTLRDAELAAEATDEAMVRAYQRWRRVGSLDNPAGWAYRVGLNWARSRQRRAWRSLPVAAIADAAGPEQTPVDDEVAGAVALLPANQRAVVVLRFHLDWSVDQIAVALRVPPGTVKSRLHRALAALRTELEEA
jgi:RNA polymerase sigma factor (sigma-70 family)